MDEDGDVDACCLRGGHCALQVSLEWPLESCRERKARGGKVRRTNDSDTPKPGTFRGLTFKAINNVCAVLHTLDFAADFRGKSGLGCSAS